MIPCLGYNIPRLPTYNRKEVMMSIDPFSLPGQWYKGNLHTHTTQSDGRMSPEEMVDWHLTHGYHFLALTDHRIRVDPAPYRRDGLLLLPGVELNGNDPGGGRHHVVGLGVDESVRCESSSSLQATVDAVHAAGGLAVLAHPYWTGQMSADLLKIEGAWGVEVYNGVCEKDQGKGLSTVHWDDMLAAGRRLWGLAVDDAHGFPPDDDLGRGWVMVKAEELSLEVILEALKAGAFYSTSGPEIHGVWLENGVATVRCSPVERIHFTCDWALGGVTHAWDGPPLTEARFELRHRGETYLRIECVDYQDRRAWSQPIFLEG